MTLALKTRPIAVTVAHEAAHVFLHVAFARVMASEGRLVTGPVDLGDEVFEHLLARVVVVSGDEVSCFRDRQPG